MDAKCRECGEELTEYADQGSTRWYFCKDHGCQAWQERNEHGVLEGPLHFDDYKTEPPLSEEEKALVEVILAARKIQTFLWGKANGEYGFEEWKRMFRKRVAKLDEVSLENPHAATEVKKRLLQTAALAVALIAVIEKRGGIPEAAADAPPSNLPQYSKPVKETL